MSHARPPLPRVLALASFVLLLALAGGVADASQAGCCCSPQPQTHSCPCLEEPPTSPGPAARPESFRPPAPALSVRTLAAGADPCPLRHDEPTDRVGPEGRCRDGPSPARGPPNPAN